MRLTICPDLDTITYTLAGLSDQAKGWGRADEGWRFMAALEQMGGESWFNLGDADLALHVLRTGLLGKGENLPSLNLPVAGDHSVAQYLAVGQAEVGGPVSHK